MEIDVKELERWLSRNCGVCRKVGCEYWIWVKCPVAFRIVYGGPPYNAEDTALIAERIAAGPCPDFAFSKAIFERRPREFNHPLHSGK